MEGLVTNKVGGGLFPMPNNFFIPYVKQIKRTALLNNILRASVIVRQNVCVLSKGLVSQEKKEQSWENYKPFGTKEIMNAIS